MLPKHKPIEPHYINNYNFNMINNTNRYTQTQLQTMNSIIKPMELSVCSMRPKRLTNAIKDVFDRIKKDTIYKNSFAYYGTAAYNTYCGFDTIPLINYSINMRDKQRNANDDSTDFNIIDIGAGDGAWGDALLDSLDKFQYMGLIPKNYNFHIHSLTGESLQNIDNKHTKTWDLNTHTLYGNIDIQNIENSEIYQMLYKKKTDLIVSQFCFVHL